MISPVDLFRAALWLYPRDFRRRFGPEMLNFLRERARVSSPPRLWLFVLRDIVRSLPAAWVQVARRLRPHRSTLPLSSDIAPHGTRRGVVQMLSTLVRDVRFALRNLRRTPGFTSVAVVTLALGVGANTAIFSVVNGVILRPLPYHEPDRLYMVRNHDEQTGSTSFAMSQPDIHDIQAEVRSFEASAGYHSAVFTVTSRGEPEVVRGARVTNGLLVVFHVAPVLGRDLRAEENVPGAPLVAVIGHAVWQERFGGDPGIIGRTIELSEQSYAIVGVAPPGFDYPREAEIWVPRYHNLESCGRGCHIMRMVARLAPGATADGAQAELSALASRLQSNYPDTNYGEEFPLLAVTDMVYGDVRTGLLVMLGAVGLVLLIACANVANLLSARGTARAGEIAVRSALGASRGRLMGQLLVEALVLAMVGGVLGVALARGGLAALLRLAPPNLPRLDEIYLDGTVLLFAIVIAVAVALLFGIMPAFQLSRTAVAGTLSQSGRGDAASPTRAWSRSVLLVGEVALSLMLLFGAGLLVRSFAELNAVDLGFDKERVLAFSITLPEARYGPAESVQFFERLEERLAALPGVEAVGGAFGTPLGQSRVGGSFRLLDRPEPPPGQEPSAAVRAVTPGYLATLKVPLLRGRGFEPGDRIDTRPVALVSRRFVERHYPDKDPLGQQFDLHISVGYETDEPFTIVGVVGDVRSTGVRADPVPEIYYPEAQAGSDFLRMLVRLSSSSIDILPAVRRELRAIDPNIPLRAPEMLEQAVERAYGPARFYLLLLTLFAGLAVTLAAVGLYGVVAYVVSRRTREIGIRIALGAESRDVVRLVLRQGLRPALAGIGIGLLGAWAGSRLMTSLLYDVAPHDPLTLTAVTALLLGVATLAILFPARRASRIAPVEALKVE